MNGTPGEIKEMNLREEIERYKAFAPYRDEDAFQVATAKFLDCLENNGWIGFFFSGTNIYRRGLAHNKTSAMRLGAKAKRMGSKAGVPDILIYSHCIALELKQKKGTVSPEQKAFMRKMESWG